MAGVWWSFEDRRKLRLELLMARLQVHRCLLNEVWVTSCSPVLKTTKEMGNGSNWMRTHSPFTTQMTEWAKWMSDRRIPPEYGILFLDDEGWAGSPPNIWWEVSRRGKLWWFLLTSTIRCSEVVVARHKAGKTKKIRYIPPIFPADHSWTADTDA